MHTVDIILICIIIISMIVGFKKGFISSLLTWVGLFASLIMILRFGPMVKAGIMIKFGLGNFFSTILAYLLIFILISILASLLKIVLNYLAKLLNLSFINRVFGAVFGFMNIMVILMLFLFVMDIFPYFKDFKIYLKNSIIISEAQKMKTALKTDIKEIMPQDLIKK